MFMNPHTIVVIVPAAAIRAKNHQQLEKSDEVTVFWPCHFQTSTKVVRTGTDEFHQVDADINLNVTPDVQQKFHKGMYLRFEHDRFHYYKVLDFNLEDGLFGGGNSTYDARLVRQEMSIRPTEKRSSIIEDDDELIIVESDPAPPPPSEHRRRWGI